MRQDRESIKRLSAFGGAITKSLDQSVKSDVVVHRELERMWPQSQRLNLALTLVIGPAFDQLRSEYIALQQKLVVVFQSVQRIIQRARQARDVLQLFGRKVVDVLIQRRSRIDPVLNAIDSSQQH